MLVYNQNNVSLERSIESKYKIAQTVYEFVKIIFKFIEVLIEFVKVLESIRI